MIPSHLGSAHAELGLFPSQGGMIFLLSDLSTEACHFHLPRGHYRVLGGGMGDVQNSYSEDRETWDPAQLCHHI